MTLAIFVYYTDPETGEEIDVDLGPGGEMAGVEALRHQLWGTPIMTELGLTLIPTLRNNNIFASGDELDVLEQEAKTILENADFIAERLGWRGTETILHRTGNIVKAVEEARKINGTVHIG
ncbi:MAG: hypothetical protein H7175_07180 [Burkholderiales bacterium]|nr:hypothetical protein [Anaerolineae bacterium]